MDIERKHETLEDVLTEEILEETSNLIVYNDDVNSFKHVIKTLVEVCHHSLEQAEQCTCIIHNHGKCAVKEGTYDDLVPLCSAICDRGISAEII